MKTLEKTMTEYVLEQTKECELQPTWPALAEFNDKVVAYAKLLSTPLTLGMFVCVDEDGNVLEEPKPLGYHEEIDEYEWDEKEVITYQKVLSNVLFDGFEYREVYRRNIHKTKKILCLENSDFWLGTENFCFWNMDYGTLRMDLKGKKIEDLIPYKLKLTDNFKL